MKIGIFAWFGYTLPAADCARMIRGAGFDSVMLWWGDDDITDTHKPKEKQPEIYRKHGLEIANIHMPFDNINDLWSDNLNGQNMYEVLASCIYACGEYDILVAVAHLSNGNSPSAPNETGLDRIKRLVELCEKFNVDIAFENVRRLDYLDYVFNRIESDKLKFCYDNGHEYALDRVMRLMKLGGKNGIDIALENINKPEYLDSIFERIGINRQQFNSDDYPEIDLLEKYGNRLGAIHLHDNDGTADQHLIPFDGSVPWDNVMARLKKTGYSGDLTLENGAYAATNNDTEKYTPEKYLAESMKRAKKLLSMM
jgi:sugar phosphate isomerase/epimerase